MNHLLSSLVVLISAAIARRPIHITVGCCTHLYVCTERIIRVQRFPASNQTSVRRSLIARTEWPDYPPLQYNAKYSDATVNVTTSSLHVVVDQITGAATFFQPDGTRITGELAHNFTHGSIAGEAVWAVEQSWSVDRMESLYGGGQFQNGLLNFHSAPVQLVQFNTEVVVPFFVSSKGYGLLWDNYARTMLNPSVEEIVLSAAPFNGGCDTTGSFKADDSGFHFFYAEGCHGSDWGGCASTLFVNISNSTWATSVITWDNMKNMPKGITGKISLDANVLYTVCLYSISYGAFRLFVNRPSYNRTSLRSDVGDAIDYYFVNGGSVDGTIVAYREVTGSAPMYPRWVYGFWQSRNHYKTQSEVVSVARTFRSLSIPMDAIVQDWHYWGQDEDWGPQWNSINYPNPIQMVRDLHKLNVRLMVSVWSFYGNATNFFANISAENKFIEGSSYLDTSDARARELFFEFAKESMFDIGVDALWLDGTEPNLLPQTGKQIAAGLGDRYLNVYSLFESQAIYDGLIRDFRDAQGARPFSLTRSSFAGQQRSGAVVWSGDITGTWDSLRRQVAASINYQISGIPYWTQDIGGFHRFNHNQQSMAYRELLVRWFQFAVFTPIFRNHGSNNGTEPWLYGNETMRLIVDSAIHLRYRLLPYIYSAFHRVAIQHWTVQRALVFDFADDAIARNIPDEFMYGASFLVAPILQPMVQGRGQRHVYLPCSPKGWWDFHTGSEVDGGRWIVASLSLDTIPVYVRAGSIIILGPKMQHTGEHVDPLEVRIYAGKDASFQLYDDDGCCGSGVTVVNFTWHDSSGVLEVHEVDGAGSHAYRRRLHIVRVTRGHGVGVSETVEPDADIFYTGAAVRIPLSAKLVI